MSAIKGMEGVEECVIEYDIRGREYQGMWYVCIRPYSHETFLHAILRYCDKKIFFFQTIVFY